MNLSNAQSLIEVASFGKYQCIGTKVAPIGNRLFVSFPKHQLYLYGLVEISNGKQSFYPDSALKSRFASVQDLWTDDNIFISGHQPR